MLNFCKKSKNVTNKRQLYQNYMSDWAEIWGVTYAANIQPNRIKS